MQLNITTKHKNWASVNNIQSQSTLSPYTHLLLMINMQTNIELQLQLRNFQKWKTAPVAAFSKRIHLILHAIQSLTKQTRRIKPGQIGS